MKNHDNATHYPRIAIQLAPGAADAAWLWGALGVMAFSLTLPATKLAVASIDVLIVGLGRALIAGVCSLGLLLWNREALPRRRWLRVGVVTLSVVVGFPLLSAVALQTVPSSHGAMVVALLPMVSALFAVMRAGERPRVSFWVAAATGFLAISVFCALAGFGALHSADALLLGAVLLAALGYAEGAVLAREIGGWQTICWALVLGMPLLTPIVIARVVAVGWAPTTSSLMGFGYVSLVSMWLGFFAWYRGLALGGIARIGHLQLVQPVLTLAWGHVLLGEHITQLHVLTAAVVLASVWAALRSRDGVRGASAAPLTPGPPPWPLPPQR